MNYDWRYEQGNGAGTFWKRFAFRFDDDELIHLRHGNRAAVIMGGDPWSSGSHLDAPSLAMAQLEGDAPLEFTVRSKGYFDFMEPVLVELRLRNLMEDLPLVVATRLAPEFGSVVVYIQKPDDSIVKYEPLMCALAKAETLHLAAAKGAEEGTERYSREIFLNYGGDGFYFDQPGEYRIRAVYQGLGDILIPSNTHRIRVGIPESKEANRAAQDYFSDAVGLSLYLQGSPSPYLKQGVTVLEDIASRFKDTMLGAKVAVALAHGVAQPFYRVEDAKLRRVTEADPEKALRMTAPALEALRKNKDSAFNLAYGRVVRRRAEYLRAAGKPELASDELKVLRNELAKRGVNAPVLRQYEQMEQAPAVAEPSPHAAPRTRHTRTKH
jgi:hypothetical protein